MFQKRQSSSYRLASKLKTSRLCNSWLYLGIILILTNFIYVFYIDQTVEEVLDYGMMTLGAEYFQIGNLYFARGYQMFELPDDWTAFSQSYDITCQNHYENYHLTYGNSSLTKEYNSKALIYNITYYEFYMVYITSTGGIMFNNNAVYKAYRHPNELYGEGNTIFTGDVVVHFHQLVVVGYEWCRHNFGHCIEDFFQPLTMIPKDVIKNCYILDFSHPYLADVLTDVFEIPKNHLVTIPTRQWAAVDKVITFMNPYISLNTYGISTVRLKEIFHKKYFLDKIVPENYCFSNRPKGKPRHIHNLQDVMDVVSAKLKDIKWKMIDDSFPSLKETAMVWKSVKFIFCPDGSNIVKCIFMADNCVVIAVTSGYPEWSIAMFCAAAKIFELQYDGMTGNHHSGTGSPIDVSLALRMIKVGLHALNNQKWPNNIL